MDIKLTDNQYQTFKWVITVVLPALITLIGVIMQTLDIEQVEVFLTIAVAIETFLGTIFKFSEYQYDKERE